MVTKTNNVTHKMELTAFEVEQNSIIVSVEGWRMRVYFDKNMSKKDKANFRKGLNVTVEYTGDLKDIHSVKLLPLK